MDTSRNVVMVGSTGAVGGHVASTLATHPNVARLTLLGRRPTEGLAADSVHQHTVDVLDPNAFGSLVEGHDVAVCTLGVGEPSKVSREDFVRIDKDAVLAFARACRQAGVEHFELLSSVSVDPKSRMFYLRTKGELEEGLRGLGFRRLSLFHPSMILTPTNRYGFSQAVALALWPKLEPLLSGSLRRYRGIPVDVLGRAIALNVFTDGEGPEVLEWDDFQALTSGG